MLPYRPDAGKRFILTGHPYQSKDALLIHQANQTAILMKILNFDIPGAIA
jgi:hypothetical protein